MKLIAKPEDIQTGDYLIIEWKQVATPGYGPSDPCDYLTVQTIYKATNLVEWLKEIEDIEKYNKNAYNKKIYCAIKVGSVAQVAVSITIKEN